MKNEYEKFFNSLCLYDYKFSDKINRAEDGERIFDPFNLEICWQRVPENCIPLTFEESIERNKQRIFELQKRIVELQSA